jgi:hypothetical protein
MFQTRDSLRSSVPSCTGFWIRAGLAAATVISLTAGGTIGAGVGDLRPVREARFAAGENKPRSTLGRPVNLDSAQETRLVAGDGTANASFGWAVDLDGGTLIVSAPFDVDAEDGPGAVYVYRQDEGAWVEQQKLVPSGARDYALFGYDLAIDGDWIAVGAADDFSTFLFRWNGTEWVQHQRIPAPEYAWYFATAIALDGDTLVVGAPRAQRDGLDYSGRAYVYRYDGSTFTLEQVLDISPPFLNAEAGTDVAVRGDEAFVGAPGVDGGHGAIYVFHRTDSVWSESHRLSPSDQDRVVFGSVLSVRGDLLAASARTLDPGFASIWVYRRTGGDWMEEQKLNISENAEGFGFSIAVGGGTILIGAPYDDAAGEASGSAFFFRYDGREWSEDSKLTPSDGRPQDHFGGSVAIEGTTVAVGATGADDEGAESGAAYVYDSANTPPVADAGDDEDVECASFDGAVVQLDGSASSDADSTAGTNDDIVRFEWFENFELPDEEPLGEGETLEVSLALSRHLITLRVTDSAGESATDDVIKEVVDTVAPDFAVSVAPEMLWPPNGRMVEITTAASASDVCGQTRVTLTAIEVADGGVITEAPADSRGAESGSPDLSFELRAKRAGQGKGRVYRIEYAAEDPSGNRSTEEAQVVVPHDQGARGRATVRVGRGR